MLKKVAALGFRKFKAWYGRFERFLIPVTLLGGVASDIVTFRFINLSLAFLLLGIYLVLSLFAMSFMHVYDEGGIRRDWKILSYMRLFSPLVVQFAFGALLSGFLIFYGFSGSLLVSWPFLLLIIFLMVSNDLFKRYYLHFVVHSGVYFFLLFSYFVLVFPYIFKTLSPWTFLAAGAMSVALMALYLRLLSLAVSHIRPSLRTLFFCVGGITLCMNVLYFANIIPPIPLALREAGAYHAVSRDAETKQYRLVAEDRPWIDRFRIYRPISVKERVYVFSAVFAPTDLNADIAHGWQYYDDARKQWTDAGRFVFPIAGGRDDGYRTYSNRAVFPGLWRVDVETVRGQLIGRVRFRVTDPVTSPPLFRVEWR